MLGLKDTTTGVFANYLARFSGQNPHPAWLHERRQRAFARFSQLGFPHHKHEGWRQTNVAPIAGTVFDPVPVPAPAVLVPRLRELELPGVEWSAEAARLVFLNGAYAPGLSSLAGLPAGCRIGSLAERFGADGESLLPHLDHADEDDQAFVQLNAAFLNDGAVIEIAPGTVLERPIIILHVSTGTIDPRGAGKGMSHPHTLVLAGRESQAAVIETTAGFEGEIYFTNSVTTIEVGENAAVEYLRLQQDSRAAFHVSKLRTRQQRDSRLVCHNIALGGSLVRNNVHAILDGEGAECTLNGLYALDGGQHVDNSTVLDHAQPLCTSREYYKGVLDGRAEGVFNGRIIVRPDAQHTDAIQSNKNLLLSDAAATLSSQPQLEIYADDVRCTHGATVGQLDAQALFYLRSRGLGLEESRKLLIYAFAADVLGRVKIAGMREKLEAVLWERWAN
ncbi:MAG TPA: Fe-S cluster assembly protein SufD [Terriglobales bacterium]|nr:Fe-S cluster assembly protein SufD [Terriglobales bacterium]